MSFTLTFTTDNAAFDEGQYPGEVASILRQVAQEVKDGKASGRIHDVNGNSIGTYGVTP